MPRSPLITKAVDELALYFKAITEASFIDRSWELSRIVSGSRGAIAGSDPAASFEAQEKIVAKASSNSTGTPLSGRIADLINGSVGVGSFFDKIDVAELTARGDEFKFFGFGKNAAPGVKLEAAEFSKEPVDGVSVVKPNNSSGTGDGTYPNINMYAINVNNPFMGPMTRDTGAVEIFMNAMPTLELSKCVPYINLELITLYRTAGAKAPALTLIGYLNPSTLSPVDKSMIGAQAARVKSEVLDLGGGIRSGIELFTAPQTLANMNDAGNEFVPVIDRFRPLASLGNLSLSTKLQGGTLSFTSGRLELTIHDRSRVRDLAAFVRPDLYGTTFLDITYGWSHPDGGVNSKNSFGKFLDAMKSQTRYRISNSTYSFEEGGQMKVTLSIQSVGSIDLLYLGPRNAESATREVEKLLRVVNERLGALRTSGTAAPSMTQYDIIDSFKDPTSLLRSSGDKSKIKKLRDLINNGATDPAMKAALIALVGDLTSSDVGAQGTSATGELQGKLVDSFNEILGSLPSFDKDNLTTLFKDDGNRISALRNNTVVATTTPKAGKEAVTGTNNNFKPVKDDSAFGSLSEYISFGSVFMKMIAEPIRSSGQYEEVQVIFYPFNKYAGAVHDLPISCFPIEKGRLGATLAKEAKESPELSCRAIIRLMQDRFLGFAPARAYLMAGFYNQSEDTGGAGKAELKAGEDAPKTTTIRIGDKPVEATINFQKTLEKRLEQVGISEKKLVMPRVEVAVESSKIVDADGIPIEDDRGNTKTIIKLHVYDSAMDPHSTLTDIIAAAKDNELGMIQSRIAEYNTSTSDASKKSAAVSIIEAAVDKGILQAVNRETLEEVSGPQSEGSVFYRVAGNYDSIKSLVSAGMPTLTYGSSTSAIISANLTTGGGAGLANVMMQRAFSSPGETAAENVDTGVPMQIIPASLSISTIGCPLFYPMQRFFIDFGTGTSLDSVYYVISVDTTIGKDAFKTDLKLGYGQGFASYMSINQQLSMMAANVATAVTTREELTVITANINKIDDLISDEDILIELTRALTEAFTAGAAITEDATAAINTELEKAEARITAAAAKAIEDAKRNLEALIPTKANAEIRDAQAALTLAEAKATAAAAQVEEAKRAIALVETARQLASVAPAEIAAAAADNVAAAAAPTATTV